jgi:hypothetical protein
MEMVSLVAASTLASTRIPMGSRGSVDENLSTGRPFQPFYSNHVERGLSDADMYFLFPSLSPQAFDRSAIRRTGGYLHYSLNYHSFSNLKDWKDRKVQHAFGGTFRY